MVNMPNVSAKRGVLLSSFRNRSTKRAGRLDLGQVNTGVGISSLRAVGGAPSGLLSRITSRLANSTSNQVSLLDLPVAGNRKAAQLGVSVRRTSALTEAFAQAATRLSTKPTSRGVLPQAHEQSRRQLARIDGRVRLMLRMHRPQVLGQVLGRSAGLAQIGGRISLFG